ncbi:MAG: hypothetical protein CMK59_08900 [Proteobacteria bacterium]|nr:hypothetical protein [Pseudomonadota bacterium]
MLFLLIACSEPTEIEWNISEINRSDSVTYDVGLYHFSFEDERSKQLEVSVWYPAKATENDPPGVYEPTVLSLNAFDRPDPAVRFAPVVAFSHGFFAVRFQSAYLMEHLASHGYVVVAVDHPNNTLFDFDDELTGQVLLERPDDLRHAVEEAWRRSASGEGPIAYTMERERYAVMGHSFGSHTAMVLGGGELDYTGFLSWCEEHSSARACSYADQIDPATVPNYGGSDDRVVTTIPLSPGLWYTFGIQGEGLSSVRNPFVLAGDLDTVLRLDDEIVPTFDALSNNKALAMFYNAGHYGFSDLCAFASFLVAECEGEQDGYADVEQTQLYSKHYVTSWLDWKLKNSVSTLDLLDNQDDVEIFWDSFE